MMTSDLIKYLEENLVEHGDIPVRLAGQMDSPGDTDAIECAGFSTFLDDDDRPSFVLLCDGATIDALVTGGGVRAAADDVH